MNGQVSTDQANRAAREEHAKPPLSEPDFTARVIAATGKNANPRLAEIMPSLLRHMHDFVREVNLTVDEWMAGVQLVSPS